MAARFRDRTEAGQQLAQSLKAYANRANGLVLALPRGGVPVAYEIARELNLPLDLCLVRKLGEPGQGENAIGAIAADGIRVLNTWMISWLGISQQTLQAITAREQQELERRDRVYRDHCPRSSIHGRTVILVDDGLATGATMRAAVMWVRSQQPSLLAIAVPVASKSAYRQLKVQADRLVCLYIPSQLYAVGYWYDNFTQVTDKQVCRLLAKHSHSRHPTKEATA